MALVDGQTDMAGLGRGQGGKSLISQPSAGAGVRVRSSFRPQRCIVEESSVTGSVFRVPGSRPATEAGNAASGLSPPARPSPLRGVAMGGPRIDGLSEGESLLRMGADLLAVAAAAGVVFLISDRHQTGT